MHLFIKCNSNIHNRLVEGEMRQKKPKHTTRARIKAALRLLWLHSPERAATLKYDNYSCTSCGKKQSKRKGHEVKIEVHHTEGINWDDIADNILYWIFQGEQVTLCKDCHKQITKIEKGGL